MASTKVHTQIWDGVTLTAGAADTTTSSVNLDNGYGGAISLKITNGGTAPTIAAQIQIETSHDDTKWYEMGGPLVGGLDISGVYSWGSIPIPIGTEYVRLVGGSNTGQDVTVDADISEVTAI